MPTYTGQQISTINLLASEIPPVLKELHDFVFGFNDGEIVIYELPFISSPVAPDQKCFKPANVSLQADAIFWQNIFFEIKNTFAQSQGEISITDSNRFINVTTKFISWCKMVLQAYLSEDISAYHNKITYLVKYEDTPEGVKINLYNTEITEPTTTLSQFSEVCEYFDGGALRIVKGYFRPQQYQKLVEGIKQKAKTIGDLLNSPSPEPAEIVQPIQIERTGTNKLLKTLGELFTFIKDSFSSLSQDIGRINTVTDFLNQSLHDTRSIELKQVRQILQGIRGEADKPTVSTQLLKYVIDRQDAILLKGSEGSYYPVELNYFPGQVDQNGLPIDPQTGETVNIVRLSINNGLIYSLRRADDNAQVRYLRLNDTLYEINTVVSVIKPAVESIQDRLSKHEIKLNEISSKLEEIKIELNSISGRL
ncbi:MAG: hypothetical protein RIM23_09930 [Coleofasciculus sp. G3-WIS-01]|uniref:hypothetical protein n=1 Tax=Coleofasciculus sp. G3-WIS-01 TaxID=3069528 RepID=UPI0032FA9555